MLLERSIATQTQLQAVNFQLSQLSDNLFAHANADLSDAHGINLVFGPTDDGHGNNISFYSDTAGDLVGSFQIALTVNGIRVYVAAKSTAQLGKDSNNGQTVSAVLDPLSGAGSSNWVSSFNAELTSVVQTVLESYLLPHTLTAYWEAHGGTVLVSPELRHFGSGGGNAAGWYDSAGHGVGRSSIKMNVDGLRIRIPCDIRLGGPAHSTLINPFSPNSHYTEIGTWSEFGISTSPYNFVIQPTLSGGTAPFAYAYKYLDQNNLWQNIAPNSDQIVPFYVFDFGNGEPLGSGTTVNYSSTTGQFTFKFGQPHAKGSYIGCIVRVLVTGGDGVQVESATDGNYPRFDWLVFHQPQ